MILLFVSVTVLGFLSVALARAHRQAAGAIEVAKVRRCGLP